MAIGEKSGDKEQAVSTPIISDPTSPYYLHPSASPGLTLTKIILKGDNFGAWEQAVILALRSQNKLGFINGSIEKPSKTDPNFISWEIINSMLCSWIINSVDDSIRATVSRINNAKLLWDCLKTRYSIKNGPKMYRIWSDLSATKQSGLSVMSYYTRFLGMWEELSNLSMLETCSCKVDSTWFDILKTYQFLMGLDESFGILRTQIINMDPLPDLDRVYAMVSQEESHRNALQPHDVSQAVGFSVQAIAAQNTNVQNQISHPKSAGSARFYCTYCQRHGHSYERCWSRPGANPPPNRGRGRGPGRGQSTRGNSPAFAGATQYDNSAPCDPSPRVNSGQSTSLSGLSDSQIRRLLALIEPPATNEKLSGPHHEESDWIG